MHDLHTVFSAEVIEGTTLTRRTLGRIRTAGAIAAYDPLTTDEALPFVTRVPPGCWPVEVLLGQTRGDTRVQLARIVFEDTEANTKKFLVDNGYTFPQLFDPKSTVAVDFGVSGVPETYFITRDGVIQGKVAAPFTDPMQIDMRMRGILK